MLIPALSNQLSLPLCLPFNSSQNHAFGGKPLASHVREMPADDSATQHNFGVSKEHAFVYQNSYRAFRLIACSMFPIPFGDS
jgi:hypothetical protein